MIYFGSLVSFIQRGFKNRRSTLYIIYIYIQYDTYIYIYGWYVYIDIDIWYHKTSLCIYIHKTNQAYISISWLVFSHLCSKIARSSAADPHPRFHHVVAGMVGRKDEDDVA